MDEELENLVDGQGTSEVKRHGDAGPASRREGGRNDPYRHQGKWRGQLGHARHERGEGVVAQRLDQQRVGCRVKLHDLALAKLLEHPQHHDGRHDDDDEAQVLVQKVTEQTADLPQGEAAPRHLLTPLVVRTTLHFTLALRETSHAPCLRAARSVCRRATCVTAPRAARFTASHMSRRRTVPARYAPILPHRSPVRRARASPDAHPSQFFELVGTETLPWAAGTAIIAQHSPNLHTKLEVHGSSDPPPQASPASPSPVACLQPPKSAKTLKRSLHVNLTVTQPSRQRSRFWQKRCSL